MICHKNKYFSVILKKTFYEIAFSHNHSAIVPIFKDMSFLIVKAKRIIVNKNLWEFPSGNPLNKKENLRNCARREFFEETGIYINNLSRFKRLGRLLPMPARSRNYVENFYVTIKEKEFLLRKKFDKEIFKIKKVNYLSLLNLIKKNQFYVSTHVALAFMLLLKKSTPVIKFR